MQIAICDDDRLHLDYTAALVRSLLPAQQPDHRDFSCGAELLQAVRSGYMPEIAILDIRMEEMDGIALAKELNRLLPGCQVIFLTSYLSYATDVYETEHIYFVLKREVEIRLADALEKAIRSLRVQDCVDTLCLLQNGAAAVLPIREVFYLERLGRKTRIASVHGDLWDTRKPEELLQGSAAAHFIRCHQSYWVNLQKVKALSSNLFALDDTMVVPVSRPYRAAARAAFLAAMKP